MERRSKVGHRKPVPQSSHPHGKALRAGSGHVICEVPIVSAAAGVKRVASRTDQATFIMESSVHSVHNPHRLSHLTLGSLTPAPSPMLHYIRVLHTRCSCAQAVAGHADIPFEREAAYRTESEISRVLCLASLAFRIRDGRTKNSVGNRQAPLHLHAPTHSRSPNRRRHHTTRHQTPR